MNVYGVILRVTETVINAKAMYTMVCSLKKHINLLTKVRWIYRDSEPTTKNILPLFNNRPGNLSERECLKYLQRYVRGLDKVFLLTFLHFVTGANIVDIISKLPVRFIKMQNLKRLPIGHTCALLLELADTYRTFAN